MFVASTPTIQVGPRVRPSGEPASPAWWLLPRDQTRSHPELGRQTRAPQWYCASRPGRVGRRQASQAEHITARPTSHILSSHITTPPRHISLGVDAGWSSPVARQAHNLKAAGSNPAPATRDIEASAPQRPGAFVILRAVPSECRSTKPAACMTPAEAPRTPISIAPLSWQLIVIRSTMLRTISRSRSVSG